jgi:hypothetical protein
MIDMRRKRQKDRQWKRKSKSGDRSQCQTQASLCPKSLQMSKKMHPFLIFSKKLCTFIEMKYGKGNWS